MRPAARFVLNELRRAREPVRREYTLKDSGLTVALRQPLVDMWPLEEIFRLREYEPPAEAVNVLGTVARPLRVLDLGGHIGLFGLFACAAFPGSTIVSFEPDPDNAALLSRCIEANSLGERWHLVQACARKADGTTEFASSYHLSRAVTSPDDSLKELQAEIAGGLSFLAGTALTLGEKRLVVECRDVFPFMADADLIKMDIEGAEWEILLDDRMGNVHAPAMVVEYHEAHSPPGDSEEAARRALARAGYETGPARRGVENGTLWAWRPGGPTS